MPRGSTNSTEGSHSSSPSSLNAPRYGTMVPKRIFVGGISPTTTEAELHELFSRYGVVTNTKIIADRAGVSKGYGFVTFDSEEEAQRAQTSGANVMLRERRLNIAPAIKKQPFTRVYDPTQSVPNGTILYHNGIPYTYHNGMAFFVTPETAYQYSATSQTTTPAATTSSYPVVYQPSMYYPQHTAYQYQNVIPSQWNASSGQWRWAPPSVGHPTYVYPTAAMMSMGGGIGGGDTSSEYQDPAIVETGTEGPRPAAATPASTSRPPRPWTAPPPQSPGAPYWTTMPAPSLPVCPPASQQRASSSNLPSLAASSFPHGSAATLHPLRPPSPMRTVPKVVNGTCLMAVAPTVSVAGFQTPSMPSAAQQAPGGTACLAAATLPRHQGQALPGRSAPKCGRGRGLASSHPRPMWKPLQDSPGTTANGLLLR
ncbi:protein boule-like isoform X3 [Ixodes scapularis]|uniref:protein boule-like isoform X3 n=1 Tax=Ixodes scapularis TaxID=6945 RepID=UPI001C38E55F|nr:protein boule-like isoform X3 [Ixodes scapularis]